jgi:hypothetical protein
VVLPPNLKHEGTGSNPRSPDLKIDARPPRANERSALLLEHRRALYRRLAQATSGGIPQPRDRLREASLCRTCWKRTATLDPQPRAIALGATGHAAEPARPTKLGSSVPVKSAVNDLAADPKATLGIIVSLEKHAQGHEPSGVTGNVSEFLVGRGSVPWGRVISVRAWTSYRFVIFLR